MSLYKNGYTPLLLSPNIEEQPFLPYPICDEDSETITIDDFPSSNTSLLSSESRTHQRRIYFRFENIIALIVATFSCSFYAVVMKIEKVHPSVIFMGVLCSLISMYTAYLKIRTNNSHGIRNRINEMKSIAATFQTQNTVLSLKIDDLSFSKERLKKIEEDLEVNLSKQGENIRTLLSLVSTTQLITYKLHSTVKKKADQALIRILFQTDENRDFHIKDGQIDVLLSRLKMFEPLIFDENEIRLFLKSNSSLEEIASYFRATIIVPSAGDCLLRFDQLGAFELSEF